MLPYLCISIKELVVSLLGLIIRPKVIEEAQTSALVKLAQNVKNLVKQKMSIPGLQLKSSYKIF